MNLNESFFLPKHKNIINNEEDLLAFIQSLFPDFIPVANQGSIFKSLTLVLFHMAGPISFSALEMFMGSFFNQNSFRVKISRYVNKGVFLSYPLKSIDLNSKTLYGLSQTENQIIRSYVPELTSDAYIRKKGKYPMHAYGIGLSTLNLMQLNTPFKFYDQEKSVSTSEKCAVITDRIIKFCDTHNWYIYLEQDMGTERTSRLLDKIENYGKCTEANPIVHLVFSSHAILPNEVMHSPFDINHLEYIQFYMETYKIDSIEDFYHIFSHSLPADILLTLKRFLDTQRIIRNVNTQFTPGNGISYAQVDKLSTPPQKSVSYCLNQLKKYISTIKNQTIVPYIKQQYLISKRKFRSLCHETTYYFLRSNYNRGYSYIANGCSIYMVPSVMLNNYYEYFNPIDSGLCEKLKKTIRGYLGSSLALEYTTVSKSFSLQSHVSSIEFRNCFSIPQGNCICVEHIGADVAGFARAACLAMTDKELSHTITLLCLCDSEEDILYFCKTACGKDDNLLKHILFAYTSELDTSAPYRRAFLENDQWKISKSIPYKYNV